MLFLTFSQWCIERFDDALRSHGIQNSSNKADAQRLQSAMDYSLLNGGKRVRPMLVYAAAKACNGNLDHADYAACAVEMVHAYSLIHDDLPAMDDDDLRRGKPTCHIQFDEATAILAGDALQTQAFTILSQPIEGLDPQQQLTMINILAKNSGLHGMAGGQSLDLCAVDQDVDLAYLEKMHNHKTGALIIASVLMGAHCNPNTQASEIKALTEYAKAIGLAFQVQDDILDVTSDTNTLGKAQGADAALNKPTYTTLMGIEGARKRAKDLHQQALKSLNGLTGNKQHLKDIADYIISRSY
jgi:geranylgeranyl diphosphate synthase type II